MPSLRHFQHRRSQLLAAIDSPVLLMAGGSTPRNYPANPYPYRPDSNMLFLFDDPEPDSAALLDPADGSVTLFLHERTAEDALWHGAVPSFDDMRERDGVTQVLPRAGLPNSVKRIAAGRPVRTLAIPDPHTTAEAAAITGEDLDFSDAARVGAPDLLQAIGQLRACKDDEEIAEMRRTAVVTEEAHRLAIENTKPGVTEQLLTGLVEGCFARHGCVPAYNSILSVRGEVLHNNRHDNVVQEGDIVLLDAGAENATGYCSDVTRSWPAGGTFSPEAAEVYDIVLRAEIASIEAVKPGVRYRDLHLLSARVITEGLVDMGILRGDVDGLVERGAHALFFPHGVGHLIGLDVHDMEAFGDAIAYPAGRSRSDQFGLAALRLDIDLRPGMTFTIEPGIYFVPAILRDEAICAPVRDAVDLDAAERFLTMNDGRGFGGIRIEDDVLCTETGHEVLTAAIPKERSAIEAMMA